MYLDQSKEFIYCLILDIGYDTLNSMVKEKNKCIQNWLKSSAYDIKTAEAVVEKFLKAIVACKIQKVPLSFLSEILLTGKVVYKR